MLCVVAQMHLLCITITYNAYAVQLYSANRCLSCAFARKIHTVNYFQLFNRHWNNGKMEKFVRVIFVLLVRNARVYTHTHTHTHLDIVIYLYDTYVFAITQVSEYRE